MSGLYTPAEGFLAVATMEAGEARTFLNSLLNKNLRVTVTDGRMFLGAFKCTDAVSDPTHSGHLT